METRYVRPRDSIKENTELTEDWRSKQRVEERKKVIYIIVSIVVFVLALILG